MKTTIRLDQLPFALRWGPVVVLAAMSIYIVDRRRLTGTYGKDMDTFMEEYVGNEAADYWRAREKQRHERLPANIVANGSATRSGRERIDGATTFREPSMRESNNHNIPAIVHLPTVRNR